MDERTEEAVRAEILVSAVDSPQRFNSFDVHEFAASATLSQLASVRGETTLTLYFPVTFQRSFNERPRRPYFPNIFFSDVSTALSSLSDRVQ